MRCDDGLAKGFVLASKIDRLWGPFKDGTAWCPSYVAGITALKGDIHVPSESHLRPLDRSRVPLWTGTWTARLTAQLFKKAPSSAFCTRDSDKSAFKNAFNQQ